MSTLEKIYKLKMSNRCKQFGFSILEIAIALAVAAFLAYGLASSVKTGRDVEEFKQTRALLQTAKNSLVTFTQTNGYMPCPDSISAPDGMEDRSSDKCDIVFGRFPSQTVGTSSKDAWGNSLYYAVVTNADNAGLVGNVDRLASYFNSSSVPFFNLDTPPVAGGSVSGALQICGENATSCSGTTPNADMIEFSAVAVIISLGKNGAFTWDNLDDATQLNAKDLENTDEDGFFWKAKGSYVGSNEFDDQLVWVNGIELKAAMLKSQLAISD